MKLIYLLIAVSLGLLWRNNSVFSRKYKALTHKDADVVRMERVKQKSLNEFVDDPYDLTSFAALSEENRIAVNSMKFEASRRNCTFFAALIVILIAPRAILSFSIAPSTGAQAITLLFFFTSIFVVYFFWIRWLFTTFDGTGRLHLISRTSIANCFLAISVSVGWHLIVNWLYK